MSDLKSAVIISGGEGVRLRPITNDIPKGLVKVAGKPLLQWVIEWLRDSGVTNLTIGVAYLKQKIINYFGDGSRYGVDIKYSVHTVEGGTGEGFRLAISRHIHDNTFLALNGDQITNIKINSLLRKHRQDNALATITVVNPRLPFGLVLADKQGFCRGFLEKPILENIICSSGVYMFERSILPYLPNIGDIERTTFPSLAKKRRIRVHHHRGLFVTVNSLRELEEANEMLKTTRKQK
ncbi:MAG TPA: nucleotidyltransferase family protein [Candidatus Binatus sp.]|nr:nucleotidyltransferase family protein [Candidatus Binatus sp.]